MGRVQTGCHIDEGMALLDDHNDRMVNHNLHMHTQDVLHLVHWQTYRNPLKAQQQHAISNAMPNNTSDIIQK